MIVYRPDAWIFTVVLVVLFPIADWMVYRRARSKQTVWLWNILAEWSLTAAALWIALRNGWTLADLGESLGNAFRVLVTLATVAAVVGALVFLNRKQKKSADSRAKFKASVSRLAKILPVNGAERRVFIAVAITAGLCEELLYRGWLLHFFAAALGSLWLGFVISCVAFGFAHVYQGRSGVIGTTLLGGVFGAIYLACGGLVVPQVLHAAMDIWNGFSLGQVLAEPD